MRWIWLCLLLRTVSAPGSCPRNNELCGDEGVELAGRSTPFRIAYPWLALVTVCYRNSMATCGGVLISDRHALSAASCVYGYEKSMAETSIFVIMGIDTLRDRKNRRVRKATAMLFGAKRGAVIRRFADPFVVYENDIVLLKFTNPTPLSRSIQPVGLVSEEQNYTLGTPMTIIRWGNVRLVSPRTDKCQKSMRSCVELLPLDRCRVGRDMTPNSTQYCVKKNEQFYLGDAGSPTVVTEGRNQSLVGIVSFGDRSPHTGILVTKIMHFKEQITQELARRG